MCLNMYLFKGYDIQSCGEVIAFIKGSKEDNIHFYYFPNNYNIHELGPDEVSHIIHLRGDKQYRILYAYIELFNFENAIVVFNMDYNGPEIKETYSKDLLNNKELDKNITIRLTRQHFEDLHLISGSFLKSYTNRYQRVLDIIGNRQMNG